MNTYYKIVTHIFGRRSTIIYEGAVKADERPKNTCEETWLVDIYEDYFNTEEEALQFVEDNRNFLKSDRHIFLLPNLLLNLKSHHK